MMTGHEAQELEAANLLVGMDQQPPEVDMQCCRRGCKVGGEILQCIAEGCEKRIHYACYQGAVLVKHGKEPLDNDIPEDERDLDCVVCTKK